MGLNVSLSDDGRLCQLGVGCNAEMAWTVQIVQCGFSPIG